MEDKIKRVGMCMDQAYVDQLDSIAAKHGGCSRSNACRIMIDEYVNNRRC